MGKKEKNNWVILAITLTLIFTFVICAWLATYHYLVDMEDRGTFGDMFGSINSLFSGLAFGGMIFAILLQRKELMLQRIDLESTRNVMMEQKLQLEAQNTTLRKQNFENTFFQLLRLHNEIANAIECSDGRLALKGSNCFNFFYSEFRNVYGLAAGGENVEYKIKIAYDVYYEKYQNKLSRYFRNLYAIVKFIENSEVENVELYVNLIRVQLTDSELLLLFYTSLSDTEESRLKPLIEKYALFTSLPISKLLQPKTHGSLYKDGAYKTIWSSAPK